MCGDVSNPDDLVAGVGKRNQDASAADPQVEDRSTLHVVVVLVQMLGRREGKASRLASWHRRGLVNEHESFRPSEWQRIGQVYLGETCALLHCFPGESMRHPSPPHLDYATGPRRARWLDDRVPQLADDEAEPPRSARRPETAGRPR